MKKRIFASLLILPLVACNSKEDLDTFFYRSYGVFNSLFEVTYNANKDLEEEIDSFVKSFTLEADPYSPHNGVNGVYAINQTSEPVKVSDDLFEAIDKAWTIRQETNGYFNPLILDLSSLWKKTLFGGIIADTNYEPTDAKIDEAKEKVPALLADMRQSGLIINYADKTIQRHGNAKLDLGGIAKGYAVEKIDQLLKKHKVKEYLINGGTSSLGFGLAEGGGSFRVRLKYTDEEDIIRYNVQNTFTSTSAVYEQYRVVSGVTYSHVINTITGLPVTDYSMAFLEGGDSTRLDAFSTACMIAGEEQTKAWEKEYNFKAALFEDKDGVADLVYENGELNRA